MKHIHKLQNLNKIHALDPSGPEYFGCDQNWYDTEWQRMSGCGPSTASTLLLYLQKTGRIELPVKVNAQKDCRLLMETVWEHVTPTPNGIYRVEQFCQGLKSFADKNGFSLQCHDLMIDAQSDRRPSLKAAASFIEKSLDQDCPIAFLNLCNGTVQNLEEWHWVTIVALEYDDEDNEATVTIFDGDKAEEIDFGCWLTTTTEGGALVYLS